jgi:hypothetical protein
MESRIGLRADDRAISSGGDHRNNQNNLCNQTNPTDEISRALAPFRQRESAVQTPVLVRSGGNKFPAQSLDLRMAGRILFDNQNSGEFRKESCSCAGIGSGL